MANLLLNPVYITRDDVRDTTDNAALIALSDDAIDMLITQAQYLIDAYLISSTLYLCSHAGPALFARSDHFQPGADRTKWPAIQDL